MAPSIAVIGAGPLGLMAIKNFKDDGFDVTGYESRAWVGGLWNYSDDDKLSVGEKTIFNSSRFRSAISDYPFHDDTDDFPSWQQMHRYLDGYANKFNLKEHIKFGSPVSGLDRKDGKWIVEVTPKDGPVRRDAFDKVAVATGSFVTPKYPKFKGIEKFKGPTMHAMHFHDGSQFKDKNVLMVGLHATAQDVAVALKDHVKHIYASHRSGVVLLPRYDPKGAAFDTGMNLNFLFFQFFMQTWCPNVFNWLLDKLIAGMSKKAFPSVKEKWNLFPAPSLAVAPPLIADEIWPLLESGQCEPVEAVAEVTGPKSVRLRDGTVLDDIDGIIYCTGYDLCTPFVPKEWNPYGKPGDAPYLYRNTFSLHPDPAVRDSLAFLGHVGVPFPGFVQHELIGMAVSQVFRGKSSLPPYEEQKQWQRENIEWRKDVLRRSKTHDSFLTAFVNFPDHFYWFDNAAGTNIFKHFGWFSASAWSFWWRDKELYKLCKTGLFSPAIWRLFDSGKRKAWPGARAQVFKDNEILKNKVEKRSELMKAKEAKKAQ